MNNFTVYQRGHTARIYRFPTFDSEDFGSITLCEAEQLQAEIDYYENVALHYRSEARKARVRAWFNRIIDGDAFFIVTGAIIAADIGFLLMLVRS